MTTSRGNCNAQAKILWCITGAGEFLKESLEVMEAVGKNAEITVFLSRAGEEVAERYGFLKKIKESWKTETENDYSAKSAGRVALGDFDAVIVSPATANTVAKIASGIADNLVTTAVSLALKTGIRVYAVPTDWAGGKVEIPANVTPRGGIVHMRPRKSDLRNIRYLEEEGIAVLETPKRLLKEL